MQLLAAPAEAAAAAAGDVSSGSAASKKRPADSAAERAAAGSPPDTGGAAPAEPSRAEAGSGCDGVLGPAYSGYHRLLVHCHLAESLARFGGDGAPPAAAEGSVQMLPEGTRPTPGELVLLPPDATVRLPQQWISLLQIEIIAAN